MAETAAAHRNQARHASRTTSTAVRRRRTDDADRRNAAAALQRALDRRDNGGATGH